MEVDQLSCLEPGDSQDSMSLRVREGMTESECEELQQGALLQEWIEKGVFDAIEKKYLRSLSFIIAKSSGRSPVPSKGGAGVRLNLTGEDIPEEGDDGVAIETYTFKVIWTSCALYRLSKS